MDNSQLLPLLGSFLMGGLLVVIAGYVWLWRRVKRDRKRMQLVEQARQLAAQQVTQARKQVEQLQRENHELRLAVRPAPRTAPVPAAAAALDAAEAARRDAEERLQAPAAREKPEAFKDTVVLRRGPD